MQSNMFVYSTILTFITVYLCFSECNDVLNGTTITEATLQIEHVTYSNKSLSTSPQNLVWQIYNSVGKQPSPCRYVPGTKKQNHQCRRDPGLPDALREAKRLALTYCEEQFRYDRWNCSIETRGKRNLFRKVYRETAFVHALTAAALTHSVARACAEGRMSKCQCGNERRPERPEATWRWGGCSDNVKHGKRVARNFLELNPLEDEEPDDERDLLRHDSEVGISTVMTTLDDKCKCHGVSGSCSMRTCWRRLHDFNMTANILRHKYQEAKRKLLHSKTSKRNTYFHQPPPTFLPFISSSRKYSRSSRGRPELILIPPNTPFNMPRQTYSSPYQQLFYIEPSPTYCALTRGRQCEHADNCATLCCGRGFDKRVIKTVEKCKCRFKNNRCCEVVCEYCDKYEERLYCK